MVQQLILLQSYIGPAALFAYEVTCGGKRIEGVEREALAIKYGSKNGNRLLYRSEWFLVQPGDIITIRIISQEEVMDKSLLYTIPPDGLADPPLHQDDERAGCNLHHYLHSQGCDAEEFLPRGVSS